MVYDNPAQKAWMEAVRRQEIERRQSIQDAADRRRQKARDDAKLARRQGISIEICAAAGEAGYDLDPGLEEFLVCLLERLDRR